MTTRKIRELCATAPSLLWLVGLLIVPTLLVLTVAFKKADPMGWTQHMNSLKAQAEEIVTAELITS